MYKWVIRIILLVFIGCRSIQPLAPTIEELNIPEDFNNYTFVNLDNSPIRTIRISIHVIQDSLGKGNFAIIDSLGNHAPEWYWLRGLVDDASRRMADLQPMQMPSNSNHIKDSRIRYEVVGMYDWQDQGLFNLSKVYPSTGEGMFAYIMDQDEVTHKENSLHLFLAGSTNNDNGKIASRGIASGAPDKRWTVLFNYHNQYKRKNKYWPASLISHEIGHNLGLSHTWNRNDGCDDTPRKSAQCWALNEPRSKACDEISECSNNLMDYNAWQNALTECQLAKIHYNINQNRGNLRDIVHWDYEHIRIECDTIIAPAVIKDNGTIRMQCEAGRPIKWFISPRVAVLNPIGSGNEAKIRVKNGFNGRALITFRISLPQSGYIELTEKIKLRSSK